MIFVTVGTQLPFDRLVRFMDRWAANSGEEVFAQTGPTKEAFHHIENKPFLTPAEFDTKFLQATLIVAHAGMGSILTALSYGKPLIVMPRRANLREHRNDHQMATARRFADTGTVHVSFDESALETLLSNDRVFTVGATISRHAPALFLENIKQIINGSI